MSGLEFSRVVVVVLHGKNHERTWQGKMAYHRVSFSNTELAGFAAKVIFHVREAD